MSAQWITGHVSKLIGLDEETVGSQITPMLEGIRDKATLRRQLEDLVGFSTDAKSFTTTYVDARFPPPPSASASAGGKQAPRTIKLGPAGPSLTRNALPSTSAKGKKAASAAGSAAGSRAPSGRASPVDPVAEAFGGRGSVYLKGREGEGEGAWARMGAGGSGSGNGRATPDGAHQHQQQQRYRQAGALVSHLDTPPARPVSRQPSRAPTPPAAPAPLTQAERDAIEAAKSDEVRRLEKMMRELGALDGVTDEAAERRRRAKAKEPCFCLARLHPLSTYTPACSSCGFIACTLQPPHIPCPSCGTPLLTPLARARVIRRMQGELEEQLRREEAARDALERAKREAALIQSGGGAFPSLGGPRAQTAAQAQQNARKVLTLGGGGQGKTKGKPSVTTYTKNAAPPASARPTRPSSPKVTRIPRPSGQRAEEDHLAALERARVFRVQSGRPFARLPRMREGMPGDEDLPEAVYVPLKEAALAEDERGGRRGKKKGKGVDGAVVPGAG